MKTDEVLALVTDLKKSLEELHKKVETSSAAERVRSPGKSEKHVKANFEVGDYVPVGQHRLERKSNTHTHTYIKETHTAHPSLKKLVPRCDNSSVQNSRRTNPTSGHLPIHKSRRTNWSRKQRTT